MAARNYNSQHPLAVWRRGAGYTQRELAGKLLVSVRTVQAIEIGKLPLSKRLTLRWEALKQGGIPEVEAKPPPPPPLGAGERRAVIRFLERRVRRYRMSLYARAGVALPKNAEERKLMSTEGPFQS